MNQTYAHKVVLEPIDAAQLHSLGLRITGEQIHQVRDEKKELLGKPLSAGENISIDYLIDGEKARVIFNILEVSPSPPATCCYVGEETLVVIMDENTKKNPGPNERAALTDLLKKDLRRLEEDIQLCNSYNLNPKNLRAEAQRLHSSLQ